MRSKLLYEEGGLKTFILVFDKEETVKDSLLRLATQNRLSAVQISAIGGFSEVTLGYFDRLTKTYKQIPIQEQVEVLSFSGNIVVKVDKPTLHAHVVVGKIGRNHTRRSLLAGKGVANVGDDHC